MFLCIAKMFTKARHSRTPSTPYMQQLISYKYDELGALAMALLNDTYHDSVPSDFAQSTNNTASIDLAAPFCRNVNEATHNSSHHRW